MIDYHHRTWYSCNADGAWEKTTVSELYDLLSEFGVTDAEKVSKIVQQFIYREQEAHGRVYGDEKRAQLRFKL